MIFKAVELEWNGETFTVPPNRVLGAIAIIEEHFTFHDLANATQTKNISLVKLSRAYGDVMRYAGAKLTDDEVYLGMFTGNPAAKILASTNMLLAMMIPPSILAAAEETPKGNPVAPVPNGRAKAKPSKPHTKRLSARDE